MFWDKGLDDLQAISGGGGKYTTAFTCVGYWRRLNWASAEFALLSDVAMGALGGDLKRKEKLTGRYADWFSWMLLGGAALGD